MARRSRPSLAALVTLALAACGGGSPADPCQPYQAYDNVIRDAAEWKAFADSGCRVVKGHLTILAGSADPASAPAVEEVTGGVAISLNSPYREVSLPHLRAIGQGLLVGASAQEAVSLPSLASVEHVSLWDNTGLKTLDLPALAEIRNSLWVSSNSEIEMLDLPALTIIAGSLSLSRNPALARATFPALATAGAMFISNGSALAACDFPALAEVRDSVFLFDLAALPAVELPALRVVGTAGHASGLHVFSLGAATHVSLPALRRVNGLLDVTFNGTLGALSVPALESVDSLSIRGNPVYPECEALALRDRLSASGGLLDSLVGGNDTSATCSP